ncbi:MAG: LPS assembly lipoprotein LptE [Bacteroidota bacterium]
MSRPVVLRAWPLALLAWGLAACGIYSFSGATIPDRLQTVAVPLVEDRSTGGPPGLDRILTDALVDRFADRSRLALEPDEADADAVVRATIERYTVAPAAVTSENAAALNRVTLSVRVVVADQVEDGDLLSRSFSASEDTEPAAGLAGEADAATLALEQIARDAFTAATSDW